jgi:hypothetical protein
MAETKGLKRQSRKILDYKRVFGSEEGQRVLNDILSHAFFLQTSFARDPYETAFNEGMRNMGVLILRNLNTDLGAIHDRIKKIQEDFKDES